MTTPIRSVSDPEFTDFVDAIGEDYEHDIVSLDILQRLDTEEDAATFL
jgi:hypothetical protein